MKKRVGKDERQERLANTLKCWNEFVEKFFVDKKNFLYPGQDEGGRIFSKSAIASAINALAGAGEGKFNEVMPAAFADEDVSAKYLFSHAVFVYMLIITDHKGTKVETKEKDINCLNLDGFAGGEKIYLKGCSGIGTHLKINKGKKSAVEYVLRLFKHLEEQPELARASNFTNAIKSFCEEEYKAKKGGIADSMSSIILWYVAPKEYEPISAQEEKEDIAKSFSGLLKNDPGYSEDMLKNHFEVNKVLLMIRQKLKAKHGEQFSFYDADIEAEWRFRTYMAGNKKSSGGEYAGASIDQYANPLKGKLSELAIECELIPAGTTFYHIHDKSQFDLVVEKLKARPEYIKREKNKHGTNPAALKHYGNFLAQKQKKSKQENGDSPDGGETEENGGNTMTEPSKPTKQHPLNQIFYGPPGTGKTYGVVEAALKIIDSEISDEGDERERRKKQMEKFNKLRHAGQIAMVTFHQNFSYEDFIEGIKPVLDADGNSLSYEMATGIFKEIAEEADKNRKGSDDSGKSSIDVEGLVDQYAQSVEIPDNSDDDVFINEGKRWKIERVSRHANGKFRSFFVSRVNSKSGQPLTLDVIEEHYENFEKGGIKSPDDIPPKYSSKSQRHGNAPYYYALFQKLREFKEKKGISFSKESVERKNYVLIIDEINRGNISAIFGELITLIEDDKRLGKGNVNALELTLPYSKEEFGVPDNLHIIGTMNTADRSIAMLDTALRRRFHFVEMMPKPELLSEDVGGVNCRLLLEKINARIKAEYDREHQIGHAFLMGVEGIDDLKDKFQHKIIPLLQEYFFDDWEKIAKVLNHNRFIREEKQEGESADKKLFELLPFDDSAWADPSQYRKIYGGEETPGNE